MRIRATWRLVLLLVCAVAITVLAVTTGGLDPPTSERQVERRLRAVSTRGRFPLHAARCVRDEALPRTFVCLIEGPYDAHLAWRVRWLPGGNLDVRRSDGTRLPF